MGFRRFLEEVFSSRWSSMICGCFAGGSQYNDLRYCSLIGQFQYGTCEFLYWPGHRVRLGERTVYRQLNRTEYWNKDATQD